MTTRAHAIFSVAFSLVVVVAIAWGAVLIGSPGTARLQRLDEQRLADLQTISREIQSLCQDPDIKDGLKRPLPESLDELADLARTERIRLVDPETGRRYDYDVRDATTYVLGAEFSLARDSDTDVFWNHPAGRHRFLVDALDPP